MTSPKTKNLPNNIILTPEIIVITFRFVSAVFVLFSPCQIKSNQFISGTADSKIEIQHNDNVQLLVRKGCCQR